LNNAQLRRKNESKNNQEIPNFSFQNLVELEFEITNVEDDRKRKRENVRHLPKPLYGPSMHRVSLQCKGMAEAQAAFTQGF